MSVYAVDDPDSSLEIEDPPSTVFQGPNYEPLSSLPFQFDEKATRPIYTPPPKAKARRHEELSPDLISPRSSWMWEEVTFQGRERARTHWERAAFFPYSHLFKLDCMSGVVAVAGEDEIILLSTQINSNLSENASQWPTRLCSKKSARQSNEFLALAWSVNLMTWPYTPVLAVAGRAQADPNGGDNDSHGRHGGNISIFEVRVDPSSGGTYLCLVRLLAGHGRTIRDLCFDPSHPHLLASASEDGAIYLWDIYAPGGSNEELLRGKFSNEPRHRPRVSGELVGILKEGGHSNGGVLSIDIHPSQPFLVSSGFDGTVAIWKLPKLRLGPTWPLRPPFVPPSTHSSKAPRTASRPIFSSPQLHPGCWCAQVTWASSKSFLIVSKSQAGQAPSLSVPPSTGNWNATKKILKLWEPFIFESPVPQGFNPRRTMPLGIRLLGQILLDDDNSVTDKCGIVRPSAAYPGGGQEFMLAVQRKGSLELCNPLSKSSVALSFADLPASVLNTTDAARALFPPDRDRKWCEFAPRIYPTFQATGSCKDIHLRSVAVDPSGLTIFAVGRNGRMKMWRKKEVRAKLPEDKQVQDDDVQMYEAYVNQSLFDDQ